MQRTKKVENNLISGGAGYSLNEEPIVFSKALMDTFLDEDEPSNLIGLYSFYYYTAKWQKTNQVKATISFVAKGLKWSIEKVRKNRKILLDLGLIEDIQGQGFAGKFTERYIKVNFIWKQSSINRPRGKPEDGINRRTVEIYPNALSSNNLNALNSYNLLPKDFQTFWEAYPKKAGKGAAMTAFSKLCKKKGGPHIRRLLLSIRQQKDSQQWQNPIYIPHAATWLNQSRWLDDPKEMVSYSTVRDSKGKSKPAKILEYGKWWEWSERDQSYFSSTGEELIR
jgi:hypothetical protein